MLGYRVPTYLVHLNVPSGIWNQQNLPTYTLNIQLKKVKKRISEIITQVNVTFTKLCSFFLSNFA